MVKLSNRKDVQCGESSRRPNADSQIVEGEGRKLGDSIRTPGVLIKARTVSQAGQKTSVRFGSKTKKRKKRVTSRHRRMGKSQDPIEALVQDCSRVPMPEVEEIYGYRFTKEEDAILMDEVRRYIKEKKWEEEEGLERMLDSRKYVEAYGCWSVIKRSLPHRPCTSLRRRALKLFDKGSFLGRWSKGETQLLRCLQKKHENQWKYLSTLIGRSRISIMEKWRCMGRAKATGVWTREELQELSDLVQSCLRFKMLEDKSSRQLLRDNISWDKVADAIGTHSHANCCNKWYGNLSAAMVTDGLWASKDDFLLLESLLESGACMEEEVDWNSLLPHRSGQTCLLRWKQLAKHLGENRTRGFLEKLDDLVPHKSTVLHLWYKKSSLMYLESTSS
ncbi:hypothetical protein GOP47_0020789 [Adiantum capillus-veneris]|uniref:Myb-like domain-containing protein n=1 Tax=Adiantum capillus-veneris TaxID=13818 RepID=A0A9D4Z7A9_ADICA|nr:hypothetical protein GOP47_0020789 [Adiantum capillus-veneris]